jgi:RNA polymerase sigma-70 factor (ECF subfamily)
MEIEDGSSTPFEQAASHEVQQAVQRALRGVPEVFRSAVILRDLEGMAYEEVAEVLDVSVGTVKSRILRGRRLLRDILEPVLGSTPLALHPVPHANVSASHQAHGMEGRQASETVLHSPLFSPMQEKISSQPDTACWTAPRKPGDAEGGV